MKTAEERHIPARTLATVDLSAIEHNYACIKRRFPGKMLLSVLKADAYGHGIRGIVPTCDPLTDWYACATAEEGITIRESGGTKPVLIFGAVPYPLMEAAARADLTFSVGSLPYAEELSGKMAALGLTASCHLKIDTGMNRSGIRFREGDEAAALETAEQIYALPGLEFTGIYTHMACPESPEADDIRFTDLQYRRFSAACEDLKEKHPLGIRHVLSSGGSLARPEYALDMLRVGMLVYGQCDSLAHQKELELREALRWTAFVTQTEILKKGESVSYGRTFTAPRDMRIGIVSCGYADGYRRCYQQNGEVLVRGRRVPVLGRICMDFMIIDLSSVPDAEPGSEVVLLGTQGTERISAIEIAEKNASTCGEVTLAVSARVPRIYV